MFSALRNLIMLCALAAAGVQTVRIEGWRFGHIKLLFIDKWLIDVRGFKAEAAEGMALYQAERAAFLAQKKVAGECLASVKVANDSIDTLARESDRRQRSATAALGRAQERGRDLEASAARIDAGRARNAPDGAHCPTSDAVMAERENL